MKRMNLGCADDIKDGWVNVDSIYRSGVEVWDARQKSVPQYIGQFDYVLINHVLCTMKYSDALQLLKNVREVLKPNGYIEVIDVDIRKAFEAYKNNDTTALFIPEGSLDYKLCMHISGYGTRLSHYTPQHLVEMLIEAGYSSAHDIEYSEYDTRPLESLSVEATK